MVYHGYYRQEWLLRRCNNHRGRPCWIRRIRQINNLSHTCARVCAHNSRLLFRIQRIQVCRDGTFLADTTPIFMAQHTVSCVMGKQSQYRFSLYCGEELGKSIEKAAKDRNQSESEFLREAARRQLQRMQADS